MWLTMKCCRQRRETCKLVRWASRQSCLARDKDISKVVTGLKSNPVTAHEINNNFINAFVDTIDIFLKQ